MVVLIGVCDAEADHYYIQKQHSAISVTASSEVITSVKVQFVDTRLEIARRDQWFICATVCIGGAGEGGFFVVVFKQLDFHIGSRFADAGVENMG